MEPWGLVVHGGLFNAFFNSLDAQRPRVRNHLAGERTTLA